MIVDVKVDYKRRCLLLIHDTGDWSEAELIPPYFYVIAEPTRARLLKSILSAEGVEVEETAFRPVVLEGERYVVSQKYRVYKVYAASPSEVPRISNALYERGFRVAANNVRYVIRNCFDHGVLFFDSVPLYYGFDPRVNEKISRVKGLVIDVEAEEGRPVLASTAVYQPFEEVKREGVKSYRLPEEMDELAKEIDKYPIIYGHNIIGFDLPVLERAGLTVDKQLKLFFDTSVVLSTYGSSLGVGSARSLLDVALVLKDEVGITNEEIDVKRAVKGRITGLSWEELVKYNANDVVLTCKILNSIAPFIYAVSAITGIPPSEVMTLPAGMVAEYCLLRFMEVAGYVPEYRPCNARLEGERVWLRAEGKAYSNVVHLDVKAMYPSFVMANKIDPTLHRGGQLFDRSLGPGFIYALVKRLFNVRLLTKKLKKQDPRFEPVDKGVKAILNALAYGVQGKQSGLAPMGNPWCPSRIFYGTREAQFTTINELNKRGFQVVYSDTDSFFILKGNKSVEEIIVEVNKVLARWGLEADLEEVWDYMFIYSKKNYILKKGEKIIIKGSALLNLDRIYLPEAISLHELVRIENREERLKYVKEVVSSADVADLFIRGHQQVWRLIGKDVQSWKRLGERKERYIVAVTPWSEKPSLALKKGHVGHFLMPHSAPLFKFFLEDGRKELELSELNPFNIVELRCLRLSDDFIGLRARYGSYDALAFDDRVYAFAVEELGYLLRIGKKEFKVPSTYTWTKGSKVRPEVVKVVCRLKVKKVDLDEALLRRLVERYTISTLKRYGLL